MSETVEQTTLRDTLTEQFDNLETPSTEPAVETQSEQRARDEAGRFASKTEPEAQAEVSPVEAKPRPPRPSSWKKDYESHWETLDPSLAEYIHQRESEYAKGVSTYKQEAERAKDLNEAMAQFMPDLQQHNINPKDWISNLGNAHRTLAKGTQEQKLQMFARLAQDYQIDLNPLLGRPADPQYQTLAQELSQIKNWVENTTRQQQEAETQMYMSEIQKFASDTENYPHFEQAKETMAGLLQAGLAEDLKSAYDKATRFNDDIWQAEVARKQQADDSKRQEAAKSARSRAVSVKTATPSGAVSSGKTDRRSILADQLDSASGGRL